MSSEAEFPRSPLRDFDPFGKKSGDNPFSEKTAAGSANATEPESGSDNIYASSNALADPVPAVEYDAVLQPRMIIISSSFALGCCAALTISLMVIFFPLPADGRVAYALLFPLALAFFLTAALLSRFDLRAIQKGAMKRGQEDSIRRVAWLSWLGFLYCLGMELFCAWSFLEYYYLQVAS